jgi:type I restriction enzyme S subunit
MIEKKFKRTEIGLIPEDWDIEQLDSYLTLLTDFDANGSFADMANNVTTYNRPDFAWYVRATDLEQNTPMSDVKYTDEKSYTFLRKSALYGGEVLLAKRGEIGKVYLFRKKTKYATLGPNLYLLKLKDNVVPSYIYRYFSSKDGQKALKAINASTSLGAIYKNDVKSLYLPFPKYAEQQRIASALTSVDDLLSSLDKLIAKKRDIKQGAMQQLLTGKTRLKGFTEPWRNCVVQNICNITTGASNAQDQVENGIYPFYIRSEQIVRSNKYLFDGEAVITIGDGQIGKVFHYVNGKFDLHQRCYVMRNFNGVDAKFFYYYFSANFYERAMSMTAKATVDSVRMEMIADMPINIPSSIVEQQRIAKTLTLIDDEIAALESKRKKYEAVKQGMMQQLLTGKIRLL